jgi:hypothetical protein
MAELLRRPEVTISHLCKMLKNSSRDNYIVLKDLEFSDEIELEIKYEG